MTQTVNGQHCAPGVFLCLSQYISDFFSGCNCTGANNCIYISLRNLNQCAGRVIVKIEMILIKDQGSTKWTVCGPLKQWGLEFPPDDWRTPWRTFVSTSQYQNGQCNNANLWADNNQILITTRPPLNQGQDDPDFYIEYLNHWTAKVCGASDIQMKLHYADNTDSGWLQNLTIHDSSTPCPEFSNAWGW